jgi:hypothetical protein
MPTKLSETFFDILFGAVPAMLFSPIAAFGAFMGIASLAAGEPKMFFSPFSLVAYSGLLGMIGLWWVPMSDPYKPQTKRTRNFKIILLLAGIPSASIWLVAEQRFAFRVLLVLPIIFAVKHIWKLLKGQYEYQPKTNIAHNQEDATDSKAVR